MLPTFLVIGAAKAGTTSLYHYLGSHPQVHMAKLKEPDFFVAGRSWSRGQAWYERQFTPEVGERAIGEASVRYSIESFYPGVPERIAALIPGVKLVYLIRHPIERMVSQYVHNVRICAERQPPARALPTARYLEPSRYAAQIGRYLEHFGSDQLLVVLSEQLRDDRAATLRRIFEFLDVDADHTSPALNDVLNRASDSPLPRRGTRALMALSGARRLAARMPTRLTHPARRITHTAPTTPAISDALAHELEDRLRDDIRQLHAYLDGGFDGWQIA